MSVQLLLLVAALAGGTSAGQQPTTAPPKPSSNTPDDRLATPAIPPKVSVDGCVATGAEVGRKADLREKTGLDDHFVLVAARVVTGKGPLVATSAPQKAGGSMFKISGLTDEQVKIHVGRRVRIEGSFGNLEQSSVATDALPQDNLVELNVATIRQVPGDCAIPTLGSAAGGLPAGTADPACVWAMGSPPDRPEREGYVTNQRRIGAARWRSTRRAAG